MCSDFGAQKNKVWHCLHCFPIYFPWGDGARNWSRMRSRASWWLTGKESTCQCRSHEFNPWFGKIPWRRRWQPTPVFLPGKSHGPRSLAGYSPWGCKWVRHNLVTKQQQILPYFLKVPYANSPLSSRSAIIWVPSPLSDEMTIAEIYISAIVILSDSGKAKMGK